MSEPNAGEEAKGDTDLVTVVIVTYNSRRFFDRLRQSLAAQTRSFRLIVLDNASDADQRPRAEDFPPGCIVLQSEENLGFAAGNNRVVDGIETPLVALLNPDAFPAPTWLEELVAEADRRPEAASIGSTQLAAEAPGLFDGLGDCYHVFGVPWRGGFGWPVSVGAQAGECFSACAAAALYRVDAWRAVGGFDESFFCYCEDVDLGFRLRLAGFSVRQSDRAIVAHVGGGSSGKRSTLAIYHGTRNRTWTFAKNMPGWAFLLFAPAHVLATLGFMVASLLRGTAAPTFKGVRDAMLGLGPVLKERRCVQAARRTSTIAILRAMAWSPLAAIRREPVVRPDRRTA